MQTNRTVITLITTTLAIMAAICVSTICFLAYKSIDVPPELNTLTGALVGALSSMLVKTIPSETTREQVLPGEPAEVTVVNPASDPVQTEETTK